MLVARSLFVKIAEPEEMSSVAVGKEEKRCTYLHCVVSPLWY